MAVLEIRVGEKYLLDIDAFKKVSNNNYLYGIHLKDFVRIFDGKNIIKNVSFEPTFEPTIENSVVKSIKLDEALRDFYIYFGEDVPFYFYRKELFSILKKVTGYIQEEMEV